MSVTVTAIDKQLRKETARMLQYDINALTPAQEVRLSRAVMLRLELDDCATKKLAGQPFDVKAYVVASESLERLFGGYPEATTTHDFSHAREELANFLARRAERIEEREVRESARLLAVNTKLREEITQLREENAKAQSAAASDQRRTAIAAQQCRVNQYPRR
jgi:hypothetical protein